MTWCLLLFTLLYWLCASVANVIVEENKLQGTSDWWYTQPNTTTYNLEGFSDHISYTIGNTVVFKISSVSHINDYKVNIYRLGYYGGVGGRLISSLKCKAVTQPSCSFTTSTRLTDCSNWHVSTTWKIPKDAVSGVYVAVPVHESNGKKDYGTYIPFVVKQTMRYLSTKSKQYSIDGSNILFKISDLTWVAYNLYGGYNVYKSITDRSFSARASQASYNRPFQNRHAYPLGQHQNFLFGSEYAMIRWLEQYGYDVSYVACSDVELLHAAKLLTPSNYKVMLSVGHDEYWTQSMKDAYISARNSGVSLGFFSGNELFWRVLWNTPTSSSIETEASVMDLYNQKSDLSSKLAQYRTMICRKETIDNVPVTSEDQWTGTFVDPRQRPADPENSLTGQLFLVNSFRHEPIELLREHMHLWFWRDASFISLRGDIIESPSKRFPRKRKPRRSHSGEKTIRRLTQLTTNRNINVTVNRPSAVGYRTPDGYLGYEMDIYVDDCYRPSGMISLSSTVKNITTALSENFGASYKGSGVITHKLSLYRHIVRKDTSSIKISNVDASMKAMCAIKSINRYATKMSTVNSSLVFGAGTIQYSWGLSSLHDGLPVVADPVIQQATLNLLADMKAFPGSFVSEGEGGKVSFPVSSEDFIPPASVISTSNSIGGSTQTQKVLTVHPHSVLHFKGLAFDKGGGRVAAVEISFNGGKNWHRTSGRERWHYDLKIRPEFGPLDRGWHNCSSMNTNYMSHNLIDNNGGNVIAAYRDSLINKNELYDEYLTHRYSFKNTTIFGVNKQTAMKLMVLTRAIDDRGWMEEINYNRLFCSLHSDTQSSDARNSLILNLVLSS